MVDNGNCSKCGQSKHAKTASYCRKCAAEYYKIYRANKKEPNINIEGLGLFIDKIKKSGYLIDFDDMSTIIFFYQIITTDIYEYNKYSTGKQIKMMWDRIVQYYNIKSRKKIYKL